MKTILIDFIAVITGASLIIALLFLGSWVQNFGASWIKDPSIFAVAILSFLILASTVIFIAERHEWGGT